MVVEEKPKKSLRYFQHPIVIDIVNCNSLTRHRSVQCYEVLNFKQIITYEK